MSLVKSLPYMGIGLCMPGCGYAIGWFSTLTAISAHLEGVVSHKTLDMKR